MIKKIDHVGIYVSNIEQSITFYSEVFGFKLLHKGENNERIMAFLVHPGDELIQIELIQDLIDPNSYAEKGKVNHLAFTVDHMEATISFLKEKGLEFINEPGVSHVTGSKTVFFKGPDNELLQLIEPKKE